MRFRTTLSTLLLASGGCIAQVVNMHTAADIILNEGEPRGNPPAHGTEEQERSSTSTLGNAANVYTILVGAQNQVAYEPAINTIVFGHRHNPADHGNMGGTGTLRFDVSTDGGASWTIDQLLTPGLFDGSADTIIGCRYPSTTLYNPPGNTDPTNAAVVSTGMTLNSIDSALGFVNTGILQRSSARLDGSAATCDFIDHYGDRTSYQSYGLCSTPDGSLWTLSGRVSNDPENADTVTFKDFRVSKGLWNEGTQQVDWTDVATLLPNTVVYGDYNGTDTKFAQVNSWNLAFAPDGQIGYAVIIGKEYDGIPSGPMPLVWRSSDGGASWVQLPNHDFSQEPWMQENISPTNDTGEPRPWFSYDHDITVDADGTLHMVASVLSQYLANSPDSSGFIFSDISTQFIVHASTSDGVSWTIGKLSDKFSADHVYPVDVVDPPGPSQTDRPQASRTQDGEHVFFTWNRSFDGSANNDAPEIYGIGYDVSTGLWTSARSLSVGTGADQVAWWHTVSPVCISGGEDHDFELPTVFANPGDYADVPSGFIYLKGIGFDQDEFIVGVDDIIRTGSLNVYPNPGEGRFTISLVNTGKVDLTVADAQGRIVRTMRTGAGQTLLDIADQPAGIYTVSVTGERGRFAQLLMVR